MWKPKNQHYLTENIKLLQCLKFNLKNNFLSTWDWKNFWEKECCLLPSMVTFEMLFLLWYCIFMTMENIHNTTGWCCLRLEIHKNLQVDIWLTIIPGDRECDQEMETTQTQPKITRERNNTRAKHVGLSVRDLSLD